MLTCGSICQGGRQLYVVEFLGNRIIVFDAQGEVAREITRLDRAWSGVWRKRYWPDWACWPARWAWRCCCG